MIAVSRISRRIGAQTLAVLLVASLGLSGCSTVRGWFGANDDGESAGPPTSKQLVVPPDLSKEQTGNTMAIPGEEEGRPGSATYSGYKESGGNQYLAPKPDGITVHRYDGQRWLEIAAPPKDTWQWVQEFLKANNVAVAYANPALGVVETAWLANGASVTRGLFAPLVQRPGDSDVRDQFLFRVEPGTDASHSELYVADRRAAKVGGEADQGQWEARPSDPFMEAEILRGLLLYAGMKQPNALQKVAKAEGGQPAAHVDREKDGTVVLVLDEPFYNGWRRIGLALDRAGFTVEDRDRGQGRYLIRYDPSSGENQDKGFFASLAFWRKDEPKKPTVFVIHVKDQGDTTRATVTREKGEAVPEDFAQRLLVLIKDQLG